MIFPFPEIAPVGRVLNNLLNLLVGDLVPVFVPVHGTGGQEENGVEQDKTSQESRVHENDSQVMSSTFEKVILNKLIRLMGQGGKINAAGSYGIRYVLHYEQFYFSRLEIRMLRNL
jgi:hypothetical protein